MIKSRSLSIDDIKDLFGSEDHEVLSKEYTGSKQKIEYKCPNGHEHSMRLDHWKRGIRCPYCSDKFKKSIDYIRPYFEREGFSILTTVYKNAFHKFKCRCPSGHIFYTFWHNWKAGHRCPTCNGGVKKDVIGEVYGRLKIVEKLKYSKVICLCECGNYKEVYYSNLKNGSTRSCGCLRNEVYVASRLILDGLVFGKLTVVSIAGKNEKGKYIWNCKCECGNVCVVAGRALLSGNVKSCGCLVGFDITGKTFGRLTVLKKVGINKSGNALWKCVCKCGNITVVSSNHLRDGHTTSCGCFWRELTWKGGISKEPYCQEWTKELKEFIKKRDGYKGMNPYCNSKDPENLTIHHIDYNKKNCDPSNLITVCRSCNGKANFDREFHGAWYRAIMYRRYGY